MATVSKRPSGKWRAQVRREGHHLSKTFIIKGDADAWAREIERSIDNELDPTARVVTSKDTLEALIDIHIDDLAKYGQRLRRSKEAVLKRLKAELGRETIAGLTRERLIRYGEDRRKEGAGPATLAIDMSFIGTVLTHAAALHGLKADTEAVRLARIALRRMGAVGKGDERDRLPTLDELETLFEVFDDNPARCSSLCNQGESDPVSCPTLASDRRHGFTAA